MSLWQATAIGIVVNAVIVAVFWLAWQAISRDKTFLKRKRAGKPRPAAYLVWFQRRMSSAKMSFLCVPPGTKMEPITTVMTAITIAYQRPA